MLNLMLSQGNEQFGISVARFGTDRKIIEYKGIDRVSKSCVTNVISSAVDVFFCVRHSRR